MHLGKLTSVDIRTIWKHEQYDFSHWLAKPENITMLGDELGLTLTDINTEVYVGTYRCDIVASDETSSIKVIIENQLESTNHDHLGKLITYASGLDANVIVWIVAQAREEHRSAIKWLNENTKQDISFFLIELHAYQISNSLPAPKFIVVEKPNDFSKNIVNSGEMNKSQSEYLNFWTLLNDRLQEKNRPFNIRKASANHWYSVAMGTSEAHINITLVNKIKSIGIEVNIPKNKALYYDFLRYKDEIENNLHFSLEWQEMKNKKSSRIIYYLRGLDFNNQENYSQLIDAVIETVVKMKQAFKPYI